VSDVYAVTSNRRSWEKKGDGGSAREGQPPEKLNRREKGRKKGEERRLRYQQFRVTISRSNLQFIVDR